MYRKIFCVFLALCFLLTGCGKTGASMSGKSFDNIKNRIVSLNTYTCDAVMKVTNNKSTMEYKLKHYYMAPDKYKVEILEPKELSGQITIYNGKSAYIYHPGIKQYLVTENFTSSVEYNAFTGAFVEHFKSIEKLRVSEQKQGDKSCYVLEFNIPGDSRYLKLERLWVDRTTGMPISSELLDRDGKPTVEVIYENFKLNPKLDSKIFEVNKQ